jgi:threonyl-tRNA synthetase
MAGAVKDAINEVTEGMKKLSSDKSQKNTQKAKPAKQPHKGGQQETLSPEPDFIQSRMELFDKLKAEYDAEIAKKVRVSITISLPDGKNEFGTSWETTPMSVLKSLNDKPLLEQTIISEVDGDLWDLGRPLEKSCSLRFLSFEDPKGQQVFWHSSAHILGECSELCLGSHLVLGPPIENGFYYEMSLPEGASVTEADTEKLEKVAAKMVKEKQKFERLYLSKENLLEMFKYNKYKQHLIKDKIPDGTSTTVYRNGKLIDLCRGPHVSDIPVLLSET